MSNTTYIRILQAIESFSSEHLQVKKFASDFPEQLPNFATTDEAYPILFVSPSVTSILPNTNTIELTVYCYDVIQKDRANINTVLSDTNSILNDLVLWLRDGDLGGIDLVNIPILSPINNSLLDYVAGWQMTITLDVTTYTVCEIPFNEQPAVLDIVNGIVYSNYLTCETLENCGIIQDLLNSSPNLNQITFSAGFTVAANEVTMLSGWTWTIGGNNYSNVADVILEIIPEPEGYSRIDLIVADTNNTFYVVQGVPSLSTPLAPPVPVGTLQATFITIDGPDIEVVPTPIGEEFIKKAEKAVSEYFQSGVDSILTIAQNTMYKLSADVESFIGWEFSPGFMVDNQIYDGKEYIIYNNQVTDITFKHNQFGFFNPFLLQNAVDFVLKPTEAIRFIYQTNGTLLQVDNISTGSGEQTSSYTLGYTDNVTGNIVVAVKGLGKVLLTNGSGDVVGIDVDFTTEAIDTPFYNYEMTIIAADGTFYFVAMDGYTDATNGTLSDIYSDNQYNDYVASVWTGPTGEYDYIPYFSAKAANDYAFAVNQGTALEYLSFAAGTSTASGVASVALGGGAAASGNFSFAAGQNSIASGQYSTAIGFNNTASGFRSIALGSNSSALSNFSVIIGENNTGNGLSNYIFGRSNNAIAEDSYIFGRANVNYAFGSTLIGAGIQGYIANEVVVGYRPEILTGSTGTTVAIDSAFRVGIGLDDLGQTRRDGFRVYKNGATYMYPTHLSGITNGANGFFAYNNTTKKLASHNGTSWNDYALMSDIGGGDFIPLSGTSSGATVTGEIQVDPYSTNGNMYSTDGIETGGLFLDPTEASIGWSNSSNGYVSFVSAFDDSVKITVTAPASRGLVSDQDFSGNITALDYVQKKYVDNTVTAATASAQTQINALNVNNIIITTSISITTSTNDSSGYGQSGRNVMISNGANAINLSCETGSTRDFVASYTKLGSSAITFTAGAGVTLVLVDGTAVLNGIVGSTACLTRNSNTYYLQISNR